MKTVSLVLATYKEKDSVRQIIEEFLHTGLVNEVIVVNNNAEAGTQEEVAKTQARMVYEPKQGYGYAFRRGIREAKGDYIVLCEPDGTFSSSDLAEFLEKAKKAPAVFGSRTTGRTVMSPLRAWGNRSTARVIQKLFKTPPLSDIGCSYKLFESSLLKEIERECEKTDSMFATELILVTASKGVPFVEIPINYKTRTGTSAIVPSWWKLVCLGAEVFFYIFRFKINGVRPR